MSVSGGSSRFRGNTSSPLRKAAAGGGRGGGAKGNKGLDEEAMEGM